MAANVILPTKKISEMEKPDSFCKVIAEIMSIPEFANESDVREDFLVPLLKALGYSNSGRNKVERNIYLSVPDLIVGTKKKKLEKYSPDYVLNVKGSRKWLLDAKRPGESVLDKHHISQAYSYSVHREINVAYFVLCNGEEFAIFKTSESNYKPVATFKRYELDYRWQELFEMFSVEAFAERLKLFKNEDIDIANDIKKEKKTQKWDRPIDVVIEPKKQSSKIHHGTHPYFTKRPWNVVRQYIEHFTNKGEKVLDSFGGAGVTAIEAFLTGRQAYHVDINPIANFMTSSLAVPVDLNKMDEVFNEIYEDFAVYSKAVYSQKKPKVLNWYPKNIKMPADSDVEKLEDLFTTHQLACLSYLLKNIEEIRNPSIRDTFKLIFSSTLVKCNISFHNTPRENGIAGGGDAGFLKYYRYQVPKNRYQEQDPVKVFKEKYLAMVKAKQELFSYQITSEIYKKNLNVILGSATKLSSIKDKSIDYIFTDPPYGSKISYLECSTIWNEWLSLKKNPKGIELEVIAGGKLKKSDEEYVKLLQESLDEIHRVLKDDRWFSIVFASENPKFWHAIRDYCIKIGFEHVNTVCQPSQRKTVKKNQNPLTVFKGELILNFRKRKSGRNIVGINTKLPPKQYILNSAELTIVKNEGQATIEEIMQDLIPKLWESGLLGAVSNEIDDINQILKENFNYDKNKWSIKPRTRVGCHIPLDSRMKFYILSCLNRARNEERKVTVDDVIMEVLPFLRNGITPSNQFIIDELKRIAHSPDGKHWEAKIDGEFTF